MKTKPKAATPVNAEPQVDPPDPAHEWYAALREQTFPVPPQKAGTPKDNQRWLEYLFTQIIDALKDMKDVPDLYYVATFVRIVERNQGCDTPAEQFLTELVSSYGSNNFTPAIAAEALEIFKDDNDQQIEHAKFLLVTQAEAFGIPASITKR